MSTPAERLGFAHASNGSTIPDTDEDGNVVYPEAQLEIENGLHQLETLLEATVDKAFDKFEIFVLRNIFRVPDDLMGWIRLKHYEVSSSSRFKSSLMVSLQNITLNPSPEAATFETILVLRQKLQETKKLNRALKQESARNDVMIAQLKAMLSAAEESKKNGGSGATAPTKPDLDLSFLTSSPAAQQSRVGVAAGPNKQHTPLTTKTTFILSQLPALQAMLKELRPKLASLPKSGVNNEKESKSDERREYIESRIRLHLERSGQLPVGDNHNVAGRKMDISEAQALEAVTGMLTQADNKD